MLFVAIGDGIHDVCLCGWPLFDRMWWYVTLHNRSIEEGIKLSSIAQCFLWLSTRIRTRDAHANGHGIHTSECTDKPNQLINQSSTHLSINAISEKFPFGFFFVFVQQKVFFKVRLDCFFLFFYLTIMCMCLNQNFCWWCLRCCDRKSTNNTETK